MSLREQIKSRSAGLVQRETVTLPECGVTVSVRGLMAGEVRRVSDAKRPNDVQIALSAEDPDSGKPIWNANNLEDLDEIAGLHTVDAAVLLDASNRLSGIEKLGKLFSQRNENGSSPSPVFSADPSGS